MMEKKLAYIIVPLLAAAFLFLKLAVPRCLPFDVNDDANHTFVNLSVCQDALRQGALPRINLFNNFGTPLIGDALTYPFAVQSLTYWALPLPWALGVNRFVLAVLTIGVLILYFRKTAAPLYASACALLVFFNPGHIWHFAHHHYQATLFFFTVLLLLQRRMNEREKAGDFVWMCLAFVSGFLSVSLNLMLLMVPFLLVNQWFLNRSKIGLALLAAACGVLVSLPDVLYLFVAAGESIRGEQFYGFGGRHLSSIFIFAVPLTGLSLFRVLADEKISGSEKRQLWILGIFPVVAVGALVAAPAIWKSLPLLSGTDITRPLWLAQIFLVQGAGGFLQSVDPKSARTKMFLLTVCAVAAVPVAWDAAELIRDGSMETLGVGLGVGIVFIALGLWAQKFKPSAGLPALLTLAALFVAFAGYKIFGYSDFSKCRVTHYFSTEGSDRFHPRSFLEHMQPGSRLATDAVSKLGIELKINRDGILGSGNRSVFCHRGFTEYLLGKGLVSIDQRPANYHFIPPWEAEELSRLGIRYVMEKEKEGQTETNVLWSEKGLRLYANPLPTGLVYLEQDGKRTVVLDSAVSLHPNSIIIRLAEVKDPQTLVATFIAWPGWQAYIDGRAVALLAREDRLLAVPVVRGTREVELVFRPFAGWVYILAYLSAFAIPVMYFGLRRIKSRKN